MRIWTPYNAKKEWYLNIFYRETGRPQGLRIGNGRYWFGGGMDIRGERRVERFKVVNEFASVELFPGTIVSAVVCSDHPVIDKDFVKSLNPLKDEVEFVNPNEIVVVSEDMVPDLMRGNSFIQKQLTKRKRIL